VYERKQSAPSLQRISVVLAGEDAFEGENNAKLLNTVRGIRKSAFAKSLKETISVAMSVCPSA
jgi:hypothetical protein